MTLTLMRFDPFHDLERFTEQTLARGPRVFRGDNLDGTQLSAQFDRGVLLHGIPVAEVSKPAGSKSAIVPRRPKKPQIADRASRHENANV